MTDVRPPPALQSPIGDQWLLGSATAGPRDRRNAAIVAGVLAAAFIITAPHAGRPLAVIPSLILAYDAAVVVLHLVTALLLYAQYRELRQPSFLVLTCGFLCTSLIAAAHGLSFPDAITSGTLIGGVQTRAWLWMAWHGLFPLFIIAYAFRARAEERAAPTERIPAARRPATIAIAATLLLAGLATAVAIEGDAMLPSLLSDGGDRSDETTAMLWIGGLVHLAGFPLLVWATRGRRMIDIWIAVALLAGLIDLALSGLFVGGVYELGLYAGRVCALLGSSFVLAALLSQAIQVQAGLARTAAKLQQSDDRFRKILDIETIGIVFFDPGGAIIGANDAFLRMTGYSREEMESGTLSWRTMTPAEWVKDSEAQMARLAETGRIGPYEKEYILKDGSRRWMMFAGRDLGDGTISKYCIDITSRKDAELRVSENFEKLQQLQGRQQWLFAELQHRVRNTLSVVRSIARRTAETSDSVEGMDMHLQGRLAAFSRVQAVVTRNPEAGVDLASLVTDELLAHAARVGNGLVIDGPEVCLTPRAAESMSLAIHELATNAVKYGALSTPRGRIRVAWQRSNGDGHEWLDFSWDEHGSEEPPQPPERNGFGFELLERSLPYDLHATTELEFASDGLRFSMRVPLNPDVLAS